MARKLLVRSEEAAARLREDEHLPELVTRVRDETRARTAADPEWTLPRSTPTRMVLRAFAVGVLAADEWHLGYQLPFGFEDVCNHLAVALERLGGGRELLDVTLLDVEDLLAAGLADCLTWRAWGGDPAQIILVTPARPPLLPAREALDLEAALHGAALYVRDCRRALDHAAQAAKAAARP